MRSPPPPVIFLPLGRRPRCRIWFLVFAPSLERSFRAIEPSGRTISPEKAQGHSVAPKRRSTEIAVGNNVRPLPLEYAIVSRRITPHVLGSAPNHFEKSNNGAYMCIPTESKDDIFTDYFQKVHANSPLHRQIMSQIQTKRSGVGVEAVWSTPTPTPGSLPRLRATPTPTPTPTPHPWLEALKNVGCIAQSFGLRHE